MHCRLLSAVEELPEHGTEANEFLELRRLSDVARRTELGDVVLVLLTVGRREYDNWDVFANRARSDPFENHGARLLWQIQINYKQGRTSLCPRVNFVQKFYSAFTIHDDGQDALHLVFFQRFAHQPDVGGTIFYQHDAGY